MRALQKRICQYNAAEDEQIHQIISISPGCYLFLLSCKGEWMLKEFTGGLERARLVMKNILPPASSALTDNRPLLFDPGSGGFAILTGRNLLFWDSIGSRPRKSHLKTCSPGSICQNYPIQSLQVLPDGSLLLLRRHIFGHSQYYSIAVKRLESYTIEGMPRDLDPEDYRGCSYMASRPCICDMVPWGEDLLIHTPGSIRNWSRFEAETSLLIRQNRKGQVVSCKELERGWGRFSADGRTLIINPFGDDKIFHCYDIESGNSRFYITDENVKWTPGTRDTRYLYTGKQIVAWNRGTAILSELYNAPFVMDDSPNEGVQAG